MENEQCVTELFASLRLVGVTIAVCVVAYPLGMLAVAAVVAPDARMGSLVVDSEGRVVGSRLVAQGFSRPEYFWPRPSAVDYDAAGAGGSNLSPANPAIGERAEEIISRLELPDRYVSSRGPGHGFWRRPRSAYQLRWAPWPRSTPRRQSARFERR